MDKQELYVAASRAREETRIYATPEVQGEREDIAPRSAHPREGIPHIAEAAERDRAQHAAHDVAELRVLPDAELLRLRRELRPHSEAEGRHATEVLRAREQIEHVEGALARIARERARAEEKPRGERREAPASLERAGRDWRERLAETRADLQALGTPSRDACAQLLAVEAVMEERDRAALLAARIRPPAYVVTELGERPTNSRLASTWDKGVSDIERYRREHGVTDRERAFGPTPGREHEFERIAHRDATRRLQDRQAQLGRGREAGRGREIGRSFGLGR